MPDVEEQSAGGVRWLGGIVSAQAIANVILGE